MFSVCLFLLFFLLGFHGIGIFDASRLHFDSKIWLSTDGEDENLGTQWAVLLVGSARYSNYIHQADVFHAYQILKTGVPKDYTGKEVIVDNLFAEIRTL